MRNFKRIFALLLAVVMMLGLTATAYADDETEETTTGSITIENSVNGETYTLYKIFDATYSEDDEDNVAYTASPAVVAAMTAYAESSGSTCPFTFTLNSQGTYNVSTSSDASTIAEWLKGFLESDQNAISAADSKSGTGGTLEFTGLDFGYYYISTTTGSVVTIDTVAPSATVIDKNQGTTYGTKDMDADGDDDYDDDGASVEYGTVIDYKLTLAATNYVGTEKVTYYTITDKLSDGLKLNTSSIVVTVGDNTLTAETDYTITSSSSGFTIVISWVDSDNTSLYASNATITVTYSATVTELGDYDGESEYNTAAFYYNSTKINDAETTVYVYGFELVKTDSSDNSVLEGAEFTLYYDEACTQAVTLVYENGYYRVATSSDTNTTTTIEAGNVKIYGLAAGTYYLKETTAPDGYIALTAAVKVEVGSSGTSVTLDEDGTYSTGGVAVANTAGSELPSTGGMGTTLIYIIGAVLVLAAGIILVAKKRMNRA